MRCSGAQDGDFASAPRGRGNPQTAVLSMFYGYPVTLIVSWCQVSRVTARLYKSGVRQPSKAAFRLFTLHRDGRVLGDGWDGWSVHHGALVDPDGNATTQTQLRAYWIIVQLAAELASRDPRSHGRLHELLRTA